MKIALVSGSFDPITMGHMFVIDKALDIAPEVIIAVSDNPDKKHMFSAEDRKAMIIEALKEAFPIPYYEGFMLVDILPSEMLLVEYAKMKSADFIVRGIRNSIDMDYESQLNLIQKRFSSIETYYVFPPRELLEVSSSAIRSSVKFPSWRKIIKGYVPSVVEMKIAEMKGEM